MKKVMLTICLVVAACCFSGCRSFGADGSADALFTYEGKIAVLPKAKVHIGEDSAEIAKKETQASVLRTAMAEGVITNSAGLEATAQKMGF